MLDRHFRYEALVCVVHSNFCLNVKLYSEKGRVNVKPHKLNCTVVIRPSLATQAQEKQKVAYALLGGDIT